MNVLVVGAGLAVYHTDRLADERDRAQLEAKKSERVAGFLQSLFAAPDVLAYENPDAYTSLSAATQIGLERRFREGLTLSGGVAFRASRVEEAHTGREDTFGLISLPAQFDWDRSDNRLDPSAGGRLTLTNEPFVDVFGNDLAFNKSRLEYSH